MKKSPIIEEIEAFLRESGMSPSYFGRLVAGNSELVARLRKGGRVWPETEEKIRQKMKEQRRKRSAREAGAGQAAE